MPIKKSELYSSIWASCDELRGGMDASQYKDYVLLMLFVKYVSDKYTGQPYAPIVIPEGASFDDMVALKGDKEIGDKINKQIIGNLADANSMLKGVINIADFNDPDKLGRDKEMVERLSNLIAIFENPALDFSSNQAEGDDLLGDAYEYLMRHFATQSGKSKGQFYTPAEVSRVIAQVVGIEKAQRQDQTIYDPTCGSGSLLLKAAAQAPRGITIYGQEMDNATAALAKMNMILHDHPSANIWQDNSLARPHWTQGHTLGTFDFVVANPPFSNKAWRTGLDPEHDLYDRFEYGIPPQRNGDYAFLLHILKSLKSTGKGAVVLPHGVLFRGNAEGGIRRELVRRGYIKGIIGLPANLFYGTGIPACIVVLDKEHAAARAADGGGIFMIDASGGYVKDGNKNRLRHQDIRKIVDVFNGQIELPRYSRLVPRTEIEANECNLNLPRYIDTTEPEDLQDIGAHLLGGIPQRDIDDLSRYWDVFAGLREHLFVPHTVAAASHYPSRKNGGKAYAIAAEAPARYDAGAEGSGVAAPAPPAPTPSSPAPPSHPRSGYSKLRIAASELKSAILDYPAFVAYREEVGAIWSAWRAEHLPRMMGLDQGSEPRALIETLSEGLLRAFVPVRLIDKYDAYQHLMAYWTDTMQDDVYMISQDGWPAASKLRLLRGNSREIPDLKIGKLKYKADLIPPQLLIARYFHEQQAEILLLEAALDALVQEREALEEEHGGEGGHLDEARTDAGSVTRASAQKRFKEISGDPEYADESALLTIYLDLRDRESATSRAIREAQDALDKQVLEKYETLSEAEVKVLVVDDKWLATLSAAVEGELDRISQALTGRVKELAERYAEPLPEVLAEVEDLSAQVDAHLERMGFAWK